MNEQADATAVNGLKLNSKQDATGSINTTSDMSGSTTAGITNVTKCIWANASTSGRLSKAGSSVPYTTGSESWRDYSGFSIDLSHTHNIYVHSEDVETRPKNFTIKIWKRIS